MEVLPTFVDAQTHEKKLYEYYPFAWLSDNHLVTDYIYSYRHYQTIIPKSNIWLEKNSFSNYCYYRTIKVFRFNLSFMLQIEIT